MPPVVVMKSMPSRPNAMRDVPAASSDEDVPDVGERLPSKRPRAMRHRPALLVERLRVGEIDELVLGKLRMERDVHVAVNGAGQAGLAGPVGRRAAGDRLRIEHAVADDPQLAGALGDQHAPSGRNASAHGYFSAFVTTTTRIFCPSPVSNSIGLSGSGRAASPVGATGIPPWNGTVC